MKIRSAVPDGTVVWYFLTDGKNKKETEKTSVKHIRIRLIGGCVNNNDNVMKEATVDDLITNKIVYHANVNR